MVLGGGGGDVGFAGRGWGAPSTKQKQKILRRGGKNTQKNCQKKIFMTQIITMV